MGLTIVGQRQPFVPSARAAAKFEVQSARSSFRDLIRLGSKKRARLAMAEGVAVQKINVRCCIAGGGPAGMVLAYLLARAGVEVLVLEKHADFLRDFRGDTIHPTTLELMYELGLLDEFLKIPHDELRELAAEIGGAKITVSDFSHVPTHCKFIALMPQWDFLNFMGDHAKRYPEFNLRMQAEVTDLILEGDRVIGVRAKTLLGPLEVRAELVIGADGRHSLVREKAGLEVKTFGSPIDVLWMRISRHASDPPQTFGHIDSGKILVMIQRGEYWQCAFVISKGAIGAIRENGLTAFREDIVRLQPFVRGREQELKSWDDIKLLTVVIDRLKKWHRPGLLCIGDSAHAMSPIGGVGINLAIQDAVAAANILAPAFLRGATPGMIPAMEALTEAITSAGTIPEAIAMGLTPALENALAAHFSPIVLRSPVDDSSARSSGRGASGVATARDADASSLAPAYSSVTEEDLASVQRRREFPTRMMQRIQVVIQNRVISRVLSANKQIEVPLAVKLLGRFPILRRIPAYVVGIGFRPEHVETPDATAQSKE
jgi:2-polyprenyl-6-methoxyphenol hydroxylase-like FAD-dependent oxidoreductase